MMDSHQPISFDAKTMNTIRWGGMLFLVGLSMVCFFVYFNFLKVRDAYQIMCLPVAVGFLVLGVVQLVWNPLTLRKISWYLRISLILLALLSIFVVGFSTLVYLGWTLLITFSLMYFGWWRAIFDYMCMIASLLLWLSLHLDHHLRGEILSHYLSAGSVACIILVLGSILRLANQAMYQMEDANTKENIQHNQLTSLVNSMADGVIATDEAANVVLYNAAALNVLDLNSSMQGKSLKSFINLVDRDQQPVDIEKLVLGTKLANVSRDYRIRYSDGSFANLYLSIAPVHLGYGKQGSQGFVLLLRDITREKSLEEERDEFISVVSHELRTPVAISEGNVSNAQLIADKTGDMEQIKSSLQEAHTQIVFLSDMINDLATLSRAERGKLVLEVEDIDVGTLVKDLASAYKAEAGAKGLVVKADIAKKLKPLSSSKLYVREILQNFITNAIKYTEKGSVTIVAEQSSAGTVFKVVDTGIGISKGDQERVFDKFFRSEDFRTRQNNGTGLGLYVTMKLTRLIHADIDLDSELNKGSTFTITIPNIKPEGSTEKQ